jgi:hypothetical protein
VSISTRRRKAPALAATGVAVAFLVAACSAAAPSARLTAADTANRGHAGTATVIGSFVREGGPISPDGAQPPSVPLAGVVTFTPRHGHAVAVRVRRSGRFRLRLAAGRYRVAGRSPSILEQLPSGATRELVCSVPLTVSVAAHHTVHVTVVCAVP